MRSQGIRYINIIRLDINISKRIMWLQDRYVLFNSVDNAYKLVKMNAAMVWCFFIITNLKIDPKLMLSLI